jgi:ornithine carbamoyltransferase
MKRFIDLAELDPVAVRDLVALARRLEATPRPHALAGKVLGLLFMNPSLRTLASFQAGMANPALYTQVLAQQGVSAGARYGYLALYNAAYMLDDSVMVGIAVVTLGRHKLQERAGRWLKLVSGVAIVVLGLLLLFAPGALVW